MILGPDGKPARQPAALIAPDWLRGEILREYGNRAQFWRTYLQPPLYDEYGQRISADQYSEPESRVGSTVTVRKPRRFA